MTERIVITMATLHRPYGLASALEALERIVSPVGVSVEVLVVDNSPLNTSHEQIMELTEEYRWPLHQVHEKERGISHARNAGLRWALEHDIDYIAFTDDDEAVDPNWLDELLSVMREKDAAAVIGKMLAVYDGLPPWWILAAYRLDERLAKDGECINFGYTGSALVSMRAVAQSTIEFAPELALSGGEDVRFFDELQAAGGCIYFSTKALTAERYGEDRQRITWWIRRWYRTGNSTGTIALNKEHRRMYLVRSGIVRALVGAAGLLATSPLLVVKNPKPLRFLRTLCRGVGLLAAATGVRYQEYGAANIRTSDGVPGSLPRVEN